MTRRCVCTDLERGVENCRCGKPEAPRYAINTKTMMFENIDAELRTEMLHVIEDLVLRGVTPNPQPTWISDWMRTMGFNANQELLVLTTAFPQRVLLSLVHAITPWKCDYCGLVSADAFTLGQHEKRCKGPLKHK